MCILSQIDSIVILGGDDGVVTSYDLATHLLIDVWLVGFKVTALACFNSSDGFITAVGSASG